MKERATELEYLRWLYDNIDLGPAHEDILLLMQEEFRQVTGKDIPKDYELL